jgi:hypothetical protein
MSVGALPFIPEDLSQCCYLPPPGMAMHEQPAMDEQITGEWRRLARMDVSFKGEWTGSEGRRSEFPDSWFKVAMEGSPIRPSRGPFFIKMDDEKAQSGVYELSRL